MNFRKNGGFTGVDILVSVIVLLLMIPTITSVVYGIGKTNNSIDRKSNSINIATTVLETAKSTNFENVSLENNKNISDDFIDNLGKKLIGEIVPEGENTVSFTTTTQISEDHYKVEITLVPLPENDENVTMENCFAKKITVKVTYPTANVTKSIDISTVILK